MKDEIAVKHVSRPEVSQSWIIEHFKARTENDDIANLVLRLLWIAAKPNTDVAALLARVDQLGALRHSYLLHDVDTRLQRSFPNRHIDHRSPVIEWRQRYVAKRSRVAIHATLFTYLAQRYDKAACDVNLVWSQPHADAQLVRYLEALVKIEWDYSGAGHLRYIIARAISTRALIGVVRVSDVSMRASQ